MVKKIIYILVAIFLNVAFTNAQSITDAVKYQKDAEKAYNNKNYSQASNLIEKAIRIVKDKGRDVPKKMNDLKGKIDSAIRAEKKREKEKKDKAEYDKLVAEAKDDINNELYEEASDKLEAALIVYNGSEAKNLLNSIEEIKNENQASSLVSRANKALNKGDKTEALKLFEEARELDYSSVSSNQLSTLRSDISNYNSFTKEAENLYFKGEYEEAISALNKATNYMSLEEEHKYLKDNSNYKIHQLKGDEYMANGEYELAEKSYIKAKTYASSGGNSAEINSKLKQARHDKYVAKAQKNLNNGDLDAALSAIESAESEKTLSSDAVLLKKKIYEKMEDRMWQSKDYKRYLRYYPNGKYSSDAKQALTNINFLNGETMRKAHNYGGALSAYAEAKKYAGYQDAVNIEKKIKQTNRWSSAGGSSYFDFSVDIPFGLASTSMITYDQYAFAYNLSGPSGEYTQYESGLGYTKHSKTSVLAPFGLEARFYAPIRINAIPPIRFFGAVSFSTFTTFNLDNVDAVQDYTIHEEGGTYPSTSEYINSMDTIYMGLYQNALRFSQVGLKLGIRPIDYLTVYFPIQKVSLRVQPGAPCLDCTTEEVEMGEMGVGLGLEANYQIEYVSFNAFWENWNGNFNKSITNNVIFDGGTAGSGLFSPNAYSRNMGAQIGYMISPEFNLALRYENQKIRGKFRGKGGSIQEVHSYTQNLLRFRLTYNLPL